MVQDTLSTMHLYTMQSQWLPSSTCQAIDRVAWTFLWNSNPKKKRIHLVNWETVTRSKDFGGLGIKTTRENNIALMEKNCWDLIQGLDNLWVKVLTSKYLQRGSLFDHIPPSITSPLWKGILKSFKFFKDGYRWRIGIGEEIPVWYDNCLGPFKFSDMGFLSLLHYMI